MPPKNILFLLKKTEIYGDYSSITSKSGLLNSAKITAHQITKHLGIKTEIEICIDANEIDKFVTKYRPKVCLIEALWVPPYKFEQLSKLHPHVRFVVLIHSNIPFLANEGPAIGYIKKYIRIPGVYVAFNSIHAFTQFRELDIPCLYLPNIYQDVSVKHPSSPAYIPSTTLQIACFGALRPMKNQLLQAVAAITLAKKIGVRMHFHINSTRPEQGGESVLKNIRALFECEDDFKLVEHPWSNRDQFLATIRRMDIGLQISFSETFNIVSADFVLENVPIVVSSQIEWMPWQEQADMYDVEDIVSKMIGSLKRREKVVKRNVRALNKFNVESLGIWHQYLKHI